MAEGSWSEYPIEVVWEGGKRYRGGRPGGPTHVVDGERRDAPSPVEGLLVSLAACSAIDIVEILEKRKTPAASLSVRVEFARADTPPRRLVAAKVLYRVESASKPHHVERAAELSFQKYCSVTTSLRPDIHLEWEVEVSPPSDASGG